MMGYGVIGSTTDFDSVSRGSWPRIPATHPGFFNNMKTIRTGRLMVRTSPFHGDNRGSIPRRCTSGGVAERLNALDCKSNPSGYGGSNPSSSTNFFEACNSAVRVPVLYAGGRWFESIQAYQFYKYRR